MTNLALIRAKSHPNLLGYKFYDKLWSVLLRENTSRFFYSCPDIFFVLRKLSEVRFIAKHRDFWT